MTNTAIQAAGPQTESFVTPTGRYLGYIVVGAAIVLSVLGLKSQGTDAFGLIAFCIAFAMLAWVALIRPKVTAHRNGLLLRNMLRDTFLPWASIKTCRVAQTLQVGTRDKVYHGLGLTKSARQASREQRAKMGGGRQIIGPNLGMGSAAAAPTVSEKPTGPGYEVNLSKQEQVGGSYFAHAEQRIERLAQEGAAKTQDATPRISWDPLPIAALVVAVVSVCLAFVV